MINVLGIVNVFLLFLCSGINAQNIQEVEKQTFLYAVKEADHLYLDKYEQKGGEDLKPCMIFLFGGGFVGGQRDDARYIPYFHYWAEKGYVVVAIDYRLGLKGVGKEENKNPDQFLPVLTEAVRMAVEDLYTATNYILSRAEEWKIDRKSIIASGSSAGAITVLQGEYEICNQGNAISTLPSGFNYAGIVAFAGAILGTQPDLHWQQSPVPMLLFQGDADERVPFYKAGDEKGGFFGSDYIARQLTKMDIPHYFCVYLNAGHEIAGVPMEENKGEIEIFLDKLVWQKQTLIINTEIFSIGKAEMKKELDLMDYINNNFE